MNDYDLFREASTKSYLEQCQSKQLEQILQLVPARFRGKMLADFREDYAAQKHIKQIVERYILTFPERLSSGSCLVFYGKPGTGKTMLALIMYEALARINVSVGYESTLQFLRRLKEKEFESYAGFMQLLDIYLRKTFLILDEVTEGVGHGGFPSDWERKMLFTLINARYERRLCTLVISNRGKDNMIERLGEAVIDRLGEGGVFLAFDWDSYRQK